MGKSFSPTRRGMSWPLLFVALCLLLAGYALQHLLPTENPTVPLPGSVVLERSVVDMGTVQIEVVHELPVQLIYDNGTVTAQILGVGAS